MPTAVAVTHNYIGNNYLKSLKNEVVSNGDNHVVVFSGDHLIEQDTPRPGNIDNLTWKIKLVRDPEIPAGQPADLLILYIGSTDIRSAMYFANQFNCSEFHFVTNDHQKLEEVIELGKQTCGNAIVSGSVSETTGNVTMKRLVDQFLETGSIDTP